MGKKPKLAKRAVKSGTPKPVRRAIARAKIRAQKYLGVPVRAKTTRGPESLTRRKKKRGRTVYEIELDRTYFEQRNKSKENLRKLAEEAQHEFFHAAYNEYMLGNAKHHDVLVTEGIGMLSTLESKIDRKRPLSAVLNDALTKLEKDPPKDKAHLYGLIIATSILEKYPKRKDRKKHVRKIMRKNAEVLKECRRKGIKVRVNELGELHPVE